MKTKSIILGMVGATAINTAITIIISLFIGDGSYHAVHPALINDCGSEINAVIVQTICTLLYGAAWAGAHSIWEVERWSLLRQTTTHLIVCSLFTLPVAYFLRWMHHSLLGVLSYFGIFFVMYLLIWVSQYYSIKKRVQQMNAKVKENNQNSN